MIMLFPASEDRATVRTDLSADSGFKKESDAEVRHSFFVLGIKQSLSLENLKR